MSVRVLHLADSHIGAQLPARPRLRIPRRGDDFIRSFEHALGLALAHDVDLVLHAGDVFDESQPSSAALAAAAKPLLQVAAAGIPVVIVPGNHERSALPASLLLSHPNLHILHEPRVLHFEFRGHCVAVAGFPCLRRNSAVRFAGALNATGWRPGAAETNILLVHQTFESAVCGSASFRFRSGADVIERAAIPDGFDYVAAGHIHRQQILTRPGGAGPPIVYSGSVDRISFAEINEPKGCMLLEFGAGAVAPCNAAALLPGDRAIHGTFLEHAVRPMAILPVDVTDLDGPAIRDRIADWLRGLPPDALAQARLSGAATPRALRGLALARLAADVRPDVLFTTSTSAIQFRDLAENWNRRPPTERPSFKNAEPVSDRSFQSSPSEPGCMSLPPSTTVRPVSSPLAGGSAFDAITGDRGEIIESVRDELKSIPNSPGVYALHDAAGRLLYIGKAVRLRARIRQHVSARGAAAYFSGWTNEIARIEVRLTTGELEALLLEADLIRKLRPPFNRQMRAWARYCYLVEERGRLGQLRVVREPPRGQSCYGPYRSRFTAEAIIEATAAYFRVAHCPPESSRPASPLPLLMNHDAASSLCDRYFAGLCLGPCAGKVSPAEHGAALGRRQMLLSGVHAGDIETHIEKLEEQLSRYNDDPPADLPAALRIAQTLHMAFDHAATLLEAEKLIGGTVYLASPDGADTAVHLAPDGPRFEICGRAAAASNPAAIVVAVPPPRAAAQPARLTIAVLDTYSALVRQLRRLAPSGAAADDSGHAA